MIVAIDIITNTTAVTNTKQRNKKMATIRCEVTVSDANGKVVEKFPSTNKTFAKQIGSRKAKAIGGEYEVNAVEPYEYQPAN